MAENGATGRFWRLVSLSTPGVRLLAVGLGLALLAALGPGRLERGPKLCLWSRVLGHACPACGMLRATAAALRGDFPLAWAHNRMVAGFLPALAAVAALDGRRLLGKSTGGH